MKAQINSLIIIIFLMGAMNSCTKFGKNITIEGRVENPITGEGISGAEIWLLKTTMGLPGANKEIKTVFSDENGNFELNKFSFRADKIRMGNTHGDYYTIGWYKDGEYVSTNSTLEIKKGKKLHVDFHAVPYGEIKTSLHNINCGGSGDTLIFKRMYLESPTDKVFIPLTLTGCIDNEGAFAKVPSGNYKLEWTLIRSGNNNTYSHILFVPGNGQASYNIDY
jgi:hypothetical protein